MPRHLRDTDALAVVGLLERWRGPLSWELLCSACLQKLSLRSVRQTLARNSAIGDAFRAAKQRLKDADAHVTVPRSLRAAAARIARLEADVAQLRETNQVLAERFVKWQYNAYARGLLQRDLDRDLPAIDRGSTPQPKR